MTSAQIASTSTAELLAFYNDNAAKPVKRFADRKTAERRVAALVAEMDAAKPVKRFADRSAAIAATWKDPTVAAARARRMNVNVNGADYRSVAQAFQHLDLPLGRHIAFRGELRDALALDFVDSTGTVHHFALITAE